MSNSNVPNRPQTVFVIGAGASKEANLPIGSELTEHIAKCLNFYHEAGSIRTGDELTYEALKIAAKSGKYGQRPFSEFAGAGRRIASAMPQAMSIDNFIDVHNEDPLIALCGKLAIVRTILEAEARSTMKVRHTPTGPTLSFSETSKSYFSLLFQLLTENCKFSNLRERLREVCFIVFNYDRCLEHYLHYAVRNYYGVSYQDATEALASLRIFHPYGTVGSLPTQPSGVAIDLGAEISPHQLVAIASEIKTFTEGTDPDSSEIVAIHNAIRSAQRTVFLGFAYHKLNLKLLAPELPSTTSNKTRVVLGTAYHVSRSDVEIISAEIGARLGAQPKNVILNTEHPCAGFFGEYWRSLSFA